MRRRAFLTGAVTVPVGLAGCVGGGSPIGGTDRESPTADVMRIQTLEVAGSPGGTIPVRVPEGVTLLDFWATWCAPCKPQMAELREIRDRFPELHMLSITNESDEAAVKRFWREYNGTWPVAMDAELRTNETYGVTAIPTLLVIDANGEIRWKHVGLAAADTIASEVEAAGGGGGS